MSTRTPRPFERPTRSSKRVCFAPIEIRDYITISRTPKHLQQTSRVRAVSIYNSFHRIRALRRFADVTVYYVCRRENLFSNRAVHSRRPRRHVAKQFYGKIENLRLAVGLCYTVSENVNTCY